MLTKIGNNTLTLSGTTDNNSLAVTVDSGTVVLAKTSSGSPNPDVHAIGEDTLTVNGGTAQLGGTGGDQIYDLGSVTVTSGSFDTNGRSETFANLSLQGTGIGGAGALVNSAAAFSAITPTGGTTLTGNATIGVTQSTGELQLNNAIGGNFCAHQDWGWHASSCRKQHLHGDVAINDGTLALGNADEHASTSNAVNVNIGRDSRFSAGRRSANVDHLRNRRGNATADSHGRRTPPALPERSTSAALQASAAAVISRSAEARARRERSDQDRHRYTHVERQH